jgi:hypothetical protein
MIDEANVSEGVELETESIKMKDFSSDQGGGGAKKHSVHTST